MHWPGSTAARPSGAGASEIAQHPASGDAFDVQALLASLDGDVELLRELNVAFLADRPRMQDALRSSIQRGDARAVQSTAHELKGAVGIFGDSAAYKSALALERMGHDAALDGASEKFDTLLAATDSLERAVQQFLAESPPQRGSTPPSTVFRGSSA